MTYEDSLRCGACTLAGFIYCYKKQGGVVDASILDSTNSICCADAQSCPQLLDSDWVCPSVFVTEDEYKISTCPTRADTCGRKEYNLANKDESADVSITGMLKGEVCHYIIRVTSSENSLPAFEIKGLDSENVRNYFIKYFEFDDTSNNGQFLPNDTPYE